MFRDANNPMLMPCVTAPREVILAGLAAPFAAVLDLVESPIRMILTPPWTQSTGPQGGWVLLPRIRTVEPGGAS